MLLSARFISGYSKRGKHTNYRNKKIVTEGHTFFLFSLTLFRHWNDDEISIKVTTHQPFVASNSRFTRTKLNCLSIECLRLEGSHHFRFGFTSFYWRLVTLTWSSGKISSCRCLTFLNLASGCFSEDLRSAIYSALLLEPTSNESYSTFLTDSNIFSHILISRFEPWGRAKTFKFKSKRALIRFLTLSTYTSHGTSILIPNESNSVMFFSVIPVKELIFSILHWYIKTRTIISLYFQKIVKGRTDVRRMNEWMNEFSAMWSWHVWCRIVADCADRFEFST